TRRLAAPDGIAGGAGQDRRRRRIGSPAAPDRIAGGAGQDRRRRRIGSPAAPDGSPAAPLQQGFYLVHQAAEGGAGRLYRGGA
ncbi:MAG: hypothetical protein LBE02_02490, partial [Spirochaetaceae bacterium]|nr:hypothetical protein [Spirochaetaceae bacterium]